MSVEIKLNQSRIINVTEGIKTGSGEISVKPGSSDNASNLQKMFDYLYDLQEEKGDKGHTELYFPKGVYEFNATVTVKPNGVKIRGDNWQPAHESPATFFHFTKKLCYKDIPLLDASNQSSGSYKDAMRNITKWLDRSEFPGSENSSGAPLHGCFVVEAPYVTICNMGFTQELFAGADSDKKFYIYPPVLWIGRTQNCTDCFVDNVYLGHVTVGIRADAGRTHLNKISGHPILRGIHITKPSGSDVVRVDQIHFWRYGGTRPELLQSTEGSALYITGCENSFFSNIFAIGYHHGFHFAGGTSPKIHISNIDFDSCDLPFFVHESCNAVYGMVSNFSAKGEQKSKRNLSQKDKLSYGVYIGAGTGKAPVRYFQFSNVMLNNFLRNGIYIEGNDSTLHFANLEITDWGLACDEKADTADNYAVRCVSAARVEITNIKFSSTSTSFMYSAGKKGDGQEDGKIFIGTMLPCSSPLSLEKASSIAAVKLTEVKLLERKEDKSSMCGDKEEGAIGVASFAIAAT